MSFEASPAIQAYGPFSLRHMNVNWKGCYTHRAMELPTVPVGRVKHGSLQSDINIGLGERGSTLLSGTADV